MEIYSIGFTQKTAAQFFSLLKQHNIRRLLDVRLNNVSQLAGFAKRDDLKFFLREICNADYIHDPSLAPTQEMLNRYKKEKSPWSEYESAFITLMTERIIETTVDPKLFEVPTVLLCSEPTSNHCHRRLVLEYLASHWPQQNIHITHI
jgi:uncharacterized protein (DUF488 family)